MYIIYPVILYVIHTNSIYIYIMLNNLMKWGQAITGIDYMNTLGWQTAGMYIYHIYYIYTLFTIPIYICINLFMYIYIYTRCVQEGISLIHILCFHYWPRLSGYQPFSVERK